MEQYKSDDKRCSTRSSEEKIGTNITEVADQLKNQLILCSPQIPHEVVDFDKENWDDIFQISHYALDIFNYLKSREVRTIFLSKILSCNDRCVSASVRYSRLYGSSNLSQQVDEVVAHRLDGRNTGELRVESRNTLFGCQTRRSLLEQSYRQQRNVAAGRRGVHVYCEQIRRENSTSSG